MSRDDIAQDLKKEGFVKAISGSIREAFSNIPDQMRSGFDKVSGTVASNTSEIMGSALNSLVGDIKNLASGTKDMLVGGWDALFGGDTYEEESLQEEKEQTGLLKNILHFFVSKDKLDKARAKITKVKDGIFDGLGGAMLLAGTLVGGAVGLIMLPLMGILKSFLIPFEVVGSALLKLAGLGKWLGAQVLVVWEFFKSTKIFGYFKGMIDAAKLNFFTPIANFFSKIIGLGKSILGFFSQIPILGKFFAGFAKGFGTIMKGVPVLGWAITAIMGVIDFFTAFNNTQGTMYEKIKAGVTGILTGFFDPVFGLFGWIADKVLNIFGIDVEGGVGAKLKEGFSSIISSFFSLNETIVTFFTETISNLFSSIKTAISNTWEKLTNGDFIDSIIDRLTSFAENIFEFVKSLVPDFGSIRDNLFEKAKEYLPDWVIDKMKNEKTIPIAAANEEKQRAENAKAKETYESTKKLVDEMQKTRKAVENQNTAQSAGNLLVQQNNNNTQRAQRPTEFREAPDEIENFGMVFMNKSTLGGSGW